MNSLFELQTLINNAFIGIHDLQEQLLNGLATHHASQKKMQQKKPSIKTLNKGLKTIENQTNRPL